MANSARITWSGLEELRTMLRNLPRHLRDEAKDIVDHYTQITRSQLVASYPIGGTGNLRRGVVVDENITDAGVANAVISKSTHAHLWEFGTQNRKTKAGWDRGRMKPAKDLGNEGLAAIANRNRRAMERALMQMLTREGFTVTGHGGG